MKHDRFVSLAIRWWILISCAMCVIPSFGDAGFPSPGGVAQPSERDPVLHPDVRRVLAEATERMSVLDVSGAEFMLRDALKHHPDAMPLWYMLAAAMIKQNEYQKARELLEALLKRSPNDYRLLNNLSWMLSTASDAQFRDPVRALKLAQEAVLLAPDDYHVWSTLSEAHYINANVTQSLRVMRQCIELAKRNNASEATMLSYQRQLQKIQEAHSVLSLFE
ncbi:MAG TPA: tetratricopeptide repeat protein [Kiritimatiellia bacterium]|nr:tetratricopeptide repeat protein [Kiritimatiellia bacterium]